MDFVYTHLHTLSEYDEIWVIVDRLAKFSHFLPICETYSYQNLAKIFAVHIVSLHGVTMSIVYDVHIKILEIISKCFRD